MMHRLLIILLPLMFYHCVYSADFSISSSDLINEMIENGTLWKKSKNYLIQRDIVLKPLNNNQKVFDVNKKFTWCGLYPLKCKLMLQDSMPVSIEILFWSRADSMTGVKTTDYNTAVKKISDLKSVLIKNGYKIKKTKNRISKKALYFSEECFLKGSRISFIDNKKKYVSIQISSIQYAGDQKITNDSKLRNRQKDNLRGKLLENIVREPNGDVKIINIPMIDQGRKGYCAPATVARVLKYYGLNVDMYQLADLMDSDPMAGTSVATTKKLLKKIASGRPIFAKEIKFSFNRIKKYVERGIPIMWSINHPAHLRLIIGYNKVKQNVIFSDSWGENGRENSMSISKAKAKTRYLYVLK